MTALRSFSSDSSRFGVKTPLSNTIIDGICLGHYYTTLGGNLEGPGDTCHLQNPGDYYAVPILLFPLGDYGGQTPTMPPVLGNVGLAVDNPWANSNCQSDDQRNIARPLDDDGDGTADCDSGAVERHVNDPPFYDASNPARRSPGPTACRSHPAG